MGQFRSLYASKGLTLCTGVQYGHLLRALGNRETLEPLQLLEWGR